jgi:hypothetical protein
VTLRRVLIGGGILLAVAVVVLLAVLIGILIGRGQQEEVAQKETTEEKTEEKTEETTVKTEQKRNTPSKKTPPQSSVVGLGETGELFDRTVTVNDVQRPFVFPRNIPRPQMGNEFALMNVTITNTSSQPINVNPLHFKSEDSNGVRIDARRATGQPDEITSGSIAPGGELTGNLVAEVAQGDPTINLVYLPSG